MEDKLKDFLTKLARALASEATNEVAKSDDNVDHEALDGDQTKFLADRFLIELDSLQGNK